MTGTPLPTGAQTFGGIPFQIGPGGNYIWSADVQAHDGTASESITIPINEVSSTVYLLLNTEWANPLTPVQLLFTFSDNSTLEVDLKAQNSVGQLRDYNNYTWVNSFAPSWTVNGVTGTTQNVFVSNSGASDCQTGTSGDCQRLDMQTINLPLADQSLMLKTLQITDNGNPASVADATNPNPNDAQRVFLAGLDVAAQVPEPATMALLAGGLGMMLLLRKRLAR